MSLRAPVERFVPVSVAVLGMFLGSAVATAQPVFRSAVDLVNLGITVVDRKGALVTNLGPDDFEVVEKGQRQRIELFVRGSDRSDARPPLHIGLLLDTSGSMAEDLSFAQSAAVKFLKAVDWAEDMTLVDFDTQVRVTTFGHADFPRLVERVRSRKSDGLTALYDAVGIYLDGASTVNGEEILVSGSNPDLQRKDLLRPAGCAGQTATSRHCPGATGTILSLPGSRTGGRFEGLP